jgi:hypothetical protein
MLVFEIIIITFKNNTATMIMRMRMRIQRNSYHDHFALWDNDHLKPNSKQPLHYILAATTALFAAFTSLFALFAATSAQVAVTAALFAATTALVTAFCEATASSFFEETVFCMVSHAVIHAVMKS